MYISKMCSINNSDDLIKKKITKNYYNNYSLLLLKERGDKLKVNLRCKSNMKQIYLIWNFYLLFKSSLRSSLDNNIWIKIDCKY